MPYIVHMQKYGCQEISVRTQRFNMDLRRETVWAFGATDDVASPGDYDGDGKLDAAVFRPSSSTWYANKSGGGTLIQQFGITGDVPLPSAFVR